MAEESDDPKAGKPTYEVGKGKPPKAHQFRPGQSGNPRGRPKGVNNLATDLREELAERVSVREGDKTRKFSKQRALVKSTINNALKGNKGAATTTFGLILRLLNEVDASGEAPLVAEEEAILDLLQSRAARRKAGTSAKKAKPTGGDAKDGDDDNL